MTDEELLELVREAAPHLRRTDLETEAYMARLEEHHDELHGLVERLLEEDPAAGADACACLWSFWWMRGHMTEGRGLVERAAASQQGDRSGGPARTRHDRVSAGRSRDDERACRLVACADRIFCDTDSIPDPDDYVELEEAAAELRERLGERFFDTLWAEGRELGKDAARDLARAAD